MYRGQCVRLCPFGEAEAERYLEWVNSGEAASQLGRAVPVTPLEHRRWYEQAVTRSDAVIFAVYPEEESRYIGNVWLWGIHQVNRSAELRILLGDPQAQGKGYGTDACRVLLDFAFRRLNLHKVYLYVLASNPRARRAFEKVGFRPEGLLRDEFFVDGEYQDVYRMAVLASDPWLSGEAAPPAAETVTPGPAREAQAPTAGSAPEAPKAEDEPFGPS